MMGGKKHIFLSQRKVSFPGYRTGIDQPEPPAPSQQKKRLVTGLGYLVWRVLPGNPRHLLLGSFLAFPSPQV